MLKQAVPYYPVFMRSAYRISHLLIEASNRSHAMAASLCGYDNEIEHYGK